jgi:beta-galactosidase
MEVDIYFLKILKMKLLRNICAFRKGFVNGFNGLSLRMAGVQLISVMMILLHYGCSTTPDIQSMTCETNRERIKMDFDWKFSLGHGADMAKDFNYWGGDPSGDAKTGDVTGPPHPDFNDNSWESLDVPHDWAVGIGYDRSADPYHAYKKIGRAWPENCIGWYRKTFEIPSSDLGKRINIEFDGIFRDSRVWLNGHPVWHHESGYTSFGIDITDYINYGKENIIVVRADATGHELWSYEGAGIYRHVWLLKTDPLHVARWGTYVNAEVSMDNKGGSTAQLSIETIIENQGDENPEFTLISSIKDPDGKVVEMVTSKKSIQPWNEEVILQKTTLSDAELWSMESPNLYSVTTRIVKSGEIVDSYETTFGIRSFNFDADRGFFLNGEPVKLKGVCLHQDHGGVGIALPDRLHGFRVDKLKEMGSNSIRTAHNWVSPEMLDVCDRLGMTVIEEARMSGSSKELLEQLGSMVRRDRNHPSIIVWSLGNEEHVIQGTDVGGRIIRSMKREVKKWDRSRPMTIGMNGSWGSVVTEEVDIHGSNYLKMGNIDEIHEKFPHKPIILSESSSLLTTRGVYEVAEGSGHANEYDETLPVWGKTAEEMWQFVAERDWLAGTYVWTGFDYGGEPLPGFWPAVNSNFGILDRAGFPKDVFYYYQSWWSDSTVLHLSPHSRTLRKWRKCWS